jgi:hypothetical protein
MYTCRTLKLLCKNDFLTPDDLSKELKATGCNNFTSADVYKMLDSYPEIFKQSSAHVFLNPLNSVLVGRLLTLAANVEVTPCNRYNNGLIFSYIDTIECTRISICTGTY